MGLFGSKKTYVSSTIYNMAGDINQRPNFLKTLVTSNMIGNNSGKSLSTGLKDGYLQGPGLKIRNFGKWADDGKYPAVGLTEGNLYFQPKVDPSLVLPLVPHDSDQTVNIQKLEADGGDAHHWAEQWMLEHYPELIDTKWQANYNETTHEVDVLMDGGVMASFVPTGFNKDKYYVYALYNLIRGMETGPLVAGDLLTGVFPSTTGYSVVSNVASTDTRTLARIVTTTVHYSDGRPDEVTVVNTTSSASYTYYRGVFQKTEYKGSTGDTGGTDQLYSVIHTMRQYRDGFVQSDTTSTKTVEDTGTLIKTTTVSTMQESLVVVQTYRNDTQEVTRNTFSPAKLLIYEVGSGGSTAIDTLFTQGDDDGFYLPFIPLRLDNKMIDTGYLPDVYAQNKSAYRKMMGTNGYDKDVRIPLRDNKNIKDIDYAYLMPGVSLNTKSNTGKHYLYDFFEKLRLTQEIGQSDYDAWKSNQTDLDNAGTDWIEWRNGQKDPSSPYFGQIMPGFGYAYSQPKNQINIKSHGTLNANLDMTISWSAITRTVGVGIRKPGMKKGDYYVEYTGSDVFNINIYSEGDDLDVNTDYVNGLAIHWQVDDNSWKSLHITGLVHKNNIYGGKFVEISAQKALADVEESGFLVPLHYQTFKGLGIKDYTQLSMACVYMVINSYQIVKTGFFGSFFFKILIFVAIVALVIAFPPAGAAAGGILGSSAAVGAAIGLTGLTALIVGTILNMIAAMIITKLIGVISTAVFGEKVGAIIGAIVSMVAMAVGTGLAQGMSLSATFSGLTSVTSIIAMTSAVGNGIAGYIAASAQEMAGKTTKLADEYKTKSAELAEKYAAEFGIDKAALDPLANLGESTSMFVEGLDAFLQRTLMTGSDIAELTHSLLSNFTEITLSNELVS